MPVVDIGEEEAHRNRFDSLCDELLDSESELLDVEREHESALRVEAFVDVERASSRNERDGLAQRVLKTSGSGFVPRRISSMSRCPSLPIRPVTAPVR